MEKLNLNAHKLKLTGRQSTWAFVTFKCEEDREIALKTLDGYKWKGRALSVKKANPAADPLIKKRKDRNESEASSSDSKKIKVEESDLPVDEQLKNAVMPLWKVPYEQQLQQKETELKKTLVSLGRQIERVWPALPTWLHENRKLHNFQCCELEAIRASPVVDGYRNKCEFSVGWDPLGTHKTVGFRLARYSAGSMSVADASACSGIVPENMLAIGKAFQEYIQKSDKDPFNPETHAGYWRQLTVRSTRNGDALAIVVMHPQNLSPAELDEVKGSFKEFFWEGPGKSCGLTGLYFQTFDKKIARDEKGIVHIHGETHIRERLMDLTFRISPTAFFQINTPAAELLYAAIGQLANVDSSTVLLDICCGTGTIGLSLAKHVQKVIGIELVESAVDDAKYNAELNGLSNVEFRCGKVEDVVPALLFQLSSSKNVVAIVDPPRAGLHHRVIRAIRGSKHLHRLVYVSCDASAASKNLVDLCRPESNQYKGQQFAAKRAIAVDLFPHTNHCELIILLERDATPADEKNLIKIQC